MNRQHNLCCLILGPSMKVPPKRKGNTVSTCLVAPRTHPLNESPSEKEGKSRTIKTPAGSHPALNESPSEKEGKYEPPA